MASAAVFVRHLPVAGMLCVGSIHAESIMKFDELTYTVAEMMGPPQKLTVTPDGEVRYESHSNMSTPDWAEIGFMKRKCPIRKLKL